MTQNKTTPTALVKAQPEAALTVLPAQPANQQDLMELLDLAGDVRAYQAMQLVNSFASAAAISMFKRIRESNQIKHLPLRIGGEVKRVDSIREACQALFGRTYQSMLDAEADFDILGQEAYEQTKRLGLSRLALRTAGALPGTALDQVRTLIADGGTKSEVKNLIEGLAADLEQKTAQLDEAHAEHQAQEDLSATKSKQIDKLKVQLKRIQAAPPDEVLADLKREATGIADGLQGGILGALRSAVQAINSHGDERHQHDVFLAGLLGQVQACLTRVRQEFDLPDVSTAADTPAWAKAD